MRQYVWSHVGRLAQYSFFSNGYLLIHFFQFTQKKMLFLGFKCIFQPFKHKGFKIKQASTVSFFYSFRDVWRI